jgi:hypothetical protein
MHPVHTQTTYLRSILILSFHLSLRHANNLWPSGLRVKLSVHFSFSHACYAHSANLILLDLITLLILSMNFLTMQFSAVSCQFVRLGSKYPRVFHCSNYANLNSRHIPVPNNLVLTLRSCCETCSRAGSFLLTYVFLTSCKFVDDSVKWGYRLMRIISPLSKTNLKIA